MKHITPPNPIKINDSLTLSFQQFIIENVLADIQFGRDFKSLELCHAIQQAVTNTPIQLSEDSWILLCHVIQHPTNGYQPKLALPVLPFMRAVLDAQSV